MAIQTFSMSTETLPEPQVYPPAVPQANMDFQVRPLTAVRDFTTLTGVEAELTAFLESGGGGGVAPTMFNIREAS